MNLFQLLQLRARKTFNTGTTLTISVVGSFIALRVDDPDGIVTVRQFQAMAVYVGDFLHVEKVVVAPSPISGFSYHQGGVVANWERS